MEWALTTKRGASADFAYPVHRRAHRVHRLRYAVLTENLHGALVEIRRLGEMRGGRVAFNEQMLNAEI